MKLNFILVCDKAEKVSEGGKFNFFGVFDTIYADKFPAIHKGMAIVANIEKESGEHEEFFQIKKGNQVIGKGGIVKFAGQRPRHQFVHNVEDIPLPEEGKYEIEIYVDDKLVGKSYFYAKIK